MLKKWLAIILVSLLLFSSLPKTLVAAQGKDFDGNLDTYLQEASKLRGFKVTKSDIEYSLGVYEMYLDDFNNVTDLKEFLGEVIRKDGSNLKSIYKDFDMGADELAMLLGENGETLDDYVFIDDLWLSVDFYIEEKIPRDPNFDENLNIWIQEISKVRGFEVTKKQIEHSLAIYGENLDNFKTVERVRDFLGEVIEKDLRNLDWVYEMYGISQQELLQVLKENDLDINHYVFIDDLTYDLDGIIGWEDDNLEEELAQIMKEFGLTEDELTKLEEHLISIEDDLFQDENIDRLFVLAERMMAFEDFDTVTDISADQVLELISIYKEFISLFQLKVEFILIQSGTEKPIAIQDLLNLKELVNANLLVKIYNTQGDFLADLLITGEMVDSRSLHNVGTDIKDVLNEPSTTANNGDDIVKSNKDMVIGKGDKDYETVKGAKLPTTAGNFILKSVGWLFVFLLGTALFIRMRKITSEK